MARRHAKRSRKYLASRRWGRGNIKFGRGKGSKGGKGYGGGHKHKWTYMVKYEPDHYGAEPNKSLKKERTPILNVWQLEQLARNGKLQQSAGKYEASFPEHKILGFGNIKTAMVVRALAFSKDAEQKIQKAGGQAVPMSVPKKGEGA